MKITRSMVSAWDHWYVLESNKIKTSRNIIDYP